MFGFNKTVPSTIVLTALLVRWLVAQFPFSGQGSPPLYGDYEAQRHWMEITTNLHPLDWYRNTTDNDLSYWGLDYPPLTAYHMYALGFTSNKLLNSSWTQLHKSRGTDTYEHRIYMRLTVIVADLFIYMSAITYYFHNTKPIQYSSPISTVHKHNVAANTALALLYPGQILIDHGHFQYNCVFMGLVLWAVILIIRGRQAWSAMVFTLALCYKQMSLYYSLPFFWYLASSNLRVKPFWKGIRNILMIGCVVILTFAVIFLPYLRSLDDLKQVAIRLFPFNRGVFEDKVANVWFSLSIFYKYKNIYTIEDLLKSSTISTLALSLPAGLHLLWRPTLRSFKYSLVNTSLVFFLMSFQVHEKTILVPALPIILLYREHPMAVNWFVIVSTFSLQPLLLKDGQTMPFFVLITSYTMITMDMFRNLISLNLNKLITVKNISIVFYLTSILGCFILSVSAIVVKPPQRFPHIHPTINALYSCSHFILLLLFFYYRQFKPDPGHSLTTDRIYLIKKTK